MTAIAGNNPVTLKRLPDGRFSLSGSLTAEAPGSLWDELVGSGGCSEGGKSIELSGLSNLDLNGAAQLLWLREKCQAEGTDLSLTDLPTRFLPIWELAEKTLGPRTSPPPRPSLVEIMGQIQASVWQDFLELVCFLGELLSHLTKLTFKPWLLRWSSTMAITESAVVNALPVTALVAFLVGLILAFQSAMFMRLFGVDIFVADLVGLAIIRELGTLLTAIVLTGRSGSAFSAELGAMKANQEIDAFVTMGLSPVRDLVLPRVLALTFATPLLTVLADFAGCLGGNVVMMTLGHPFSVFWTELSTHISVSDLATGLFKAFVFGFTVAAIGCQRGLAAQSGPMAVGQATTSGVVTNIVVLSVLDSLFAVLFYALKW
ncbi:MAG: ABC transporter permease [Deltaproteobacteria bacterium]|nr:ABC transporter permease [Deltaproteobacteria bacterium]